MKSQVIDGAKFFAENRTLDLPGKTVKVFVKPTYAIESILGSHCTPGETFSHNKGTFARKMWEFCGKELSITTFYPAYHIYAVSARGDDGGRWGWKAEWLDVVVADAPVLPGTLVWAWDEYEEKAGVRRYVRYDAAKGRHEVTISDQTRFADHPDPEIVWYLNVTPVVL